MEKAFPYLIESDPALMTFAPRTQLHLYLQWVNVCVALSHNCALNVKAVVAASNQYQVPSRGLLRDCEIFANIRFKLYDTYTSARRYHRSRELGNYFQSNYLFRCEASLLVGMSVCPSFKVTEIFIIFKYR